MPGIFISLEGGEGAGKSTQARALADWFLARGREVVRTREPGGSPLAEAIRGLVLQAWAEGMPPLSELLLMFAARAAHLDATIRPALARDAVVICDRFVDASFAYQGAGRGVDATLIHQLEMAVVGNTRPDRSYVLDIPVQEGLGRALARGDTNRFEAESLAFMQRIRDCYLARAAAQPQRYCVVDAHADVTAVRDAILADAAATWP